MVCAKSLLFSLLAGNLPWRIVRAGLPAPPPYALRASVARHPQTAGRRVPPEAPQDRRAAISIWYVYFLELKNGDLYVGSTNDLRRSLQCAEVLARLPRTPLQTASSHKRIPPVMPASLEAIWMLSGRALVTRAAF